MNVLGMMTAATVAGLGVTGVTQAASVNYQVGAISVSAYDPANSNDGLEIHHHLFSPAAFTLDDGESHTFDAFKIWTPESSISKDDFNPQPIAVEMTFSAPGGTANLGGETYGTGTYVFLGYMSEEGHVAWSTPAIVNLGNVVYQVALSNENFQWGLFDLSKGYGIVEATVTQLASTQAVPTPAAAAIGLTLLGGLLMKRRAV